MTLAIITLLAGLAISAVAIYYSVIGLAAIFAAAVMPIIIMGTILEVSKLVSAWWLKKNWKRAPVFLKSYMLVAVIVLMFITSMGIFGFLSKAHVEQGVPTGDIIAQLESYDEQIALEQRIIEQSKESIGILDQQIERYTELGAVTKGVNARKEQKEERDFLNQTIRDSQAKVTELRRAKLPLSGNLRAVEAEVGPVKYIAQLIYGDNPDSTLLEKAVVWVIITLVFVFDPLAILLLLAAQLSFQWYREEKEKDEPIKNVPQTQAPVAPVEEVPIKEEPEHQAEAEDQPQGGDDYEDVPPLIDDQPYLRDGFNTYPKLDPLVHAKPEPVLIPVVRNVEEKTLLEQMDLELQNVPLTDKNQLSFENYLTQDAEDSIVNTTANTNRNAVEISAETHIEDIEDSPKEHTYTSEEPVRAPVQQRELQKDELIDNTHIEHKTRDKTPQDFGFPEGYQTEDIIEKLHGEAEEIQEPLFETEVKKKTQHPG